MNSHDDLFNRASSSGGQTTSTPLLLDQEASDILNECDSVLPPLRNNPHIGLLDLRRLPNWRRLGSDLASPFLEEHGSPRAVTTGLCTLFVVGTIIGLSLPKNETLPTPWYRIVSSVVGYLYFLSWSVSFYPQVISNWKRKSTDGLSADYCGLNVLGFGFYAVYNLCFYYSSEIHHQYEHRHRDGAKVTVQSNDVAFAVHAFLLSLITFCQIGYYSTSRTAQYPHKVIGIIMAIIVTVCLICFILVLVGEYEWLDFLYLLSYVKVTISLIKYVPQVILNYQRKSTVGWSIWNIILDFTGGVLSDLQLIGDCADFGDWSGITGNLAKFGLGFVSISFDIIFMIQHYVLYPCQHGDTLAAPLLQLPDEVEEEHVGRRYNEHESDSGLLG
mmetsp:Transcript_30223/g.46357  ORF Transcript_30223/g.46357 Transcript_30223/m.46357 type:complete len:387 (+) Transcript_30223:178-1338(+)|eukprot:CAMPEP_0195299062 /NCGR_PEP_ID=MMETSP0707-20130614/24780_1 /TAXON_ID=33640 /ORGANISM="Asterionellopsis glacialis, Strain CCMP134" /LENGTH=386 /DNA_ID=CAMNT_0040361335 /DNA_START=92 /DNA_END=1252 /DNA_ORIENTATION=+